MVEHLGIICKRPFCWMLVFSVDNKNYAVGSIYFDKTNTRKKEWYGRYYMALYEVTNLIFVDEESTKKELDDVTLKKKPIKETFFPFYKTFSAEALEKTETEDLTPRAKKIYEQEENTIIFNRLLAPKFPQKNYKELFNILFE